MLPLSLSRQLCFKWRQKKCEIKQQTLFGQINKHQKPPRSQSFNKIMIIPSQCNDDREISVHLLVLVVVKKREGQSNAKHNNSIKSMVKWTYTLFFFLCFSTTIHPTFFLNFYQKVYVQFKMNTTRQHYPTI